MSRQMQSNIKSELGSHLWWGPTVLIKLLRCTFEVNTIKLESVYTLHLS